MGFTPTRTYSSVLSVKWLLMNGSLRFTTSGRLPQSISQRLHNFQNSKFNLITVRGGTNNYGLLACASHLFGLHSVRCIIIWYPHTPSLFNWKRPEDE